MAQECPARFQLSTGILQLPYYGGQDYDYSASTLEAAGHDLGSQTQLS